MKTLILLGTLILLPAGFTHAASTDYYLKIEGVEGESTKGATTGAVSAPGTGPQEAGPALLEIDTIKGESSDGEKKGNVEYDWKVEEGESLESIEPDEIDYDDDGEPITPDFGILLGGGGGGDDEEHARGLERAREILEENAKASDQAIESVSLNFEKIQTKVKHDVKLFGFIALPTNATVEIDAEGEVKVKFPWWAFLASGKDSDELGQQVFNTISNVLKTKHDTIKNSIGNIR